MELKEISVSLPSGAAGDYIQQKQQISACFDYLLEEEAFQKRVKDLQTRSYPRQELSAHLFAYNERLGAGAKTLQNIQSLAEPNTYVVIGGQQAGLLTGPLYTIHKIVSILQMAKEQEKKLGKPVVPVFWIAGEDHDIEEINHVFVAKNGSLKKSVLYQTGTGRTSASFLPLDFEACWSWVQGVFQTYRETEHTNDLLNFVKDCLQSSSTYVDFFGRLIMELFKEEGLVLVDSGDSELRRLEATFFQKILHQHEGIQSGLQQQQEMLRKRGYTPLIAAKENSLHLFIHEEGERWLLEKEGDRFVYKNGSYSFAELECLMVEKPEAFSNNVVTRPLMQEYLFPTLAFIGGPGEVAYWAELQQVFHRLGFLMPPVVPRLMISYLERGIETDLQELHMSVEDVFRKPVEQMKEQWLAQQVAEPVEETFAEARQQFEETHRTLRELIQNIQPGLSSFAGKNKQKIEEQVDILERTLRREIDLMHNVQLNKFRRIQMSLQPFGHLQERTWGVWYYLNEYGFDFIPELLKLPFSWNGSHSCIRL